MVFSKNVESIGIVHQITAKLIHKTGQYRGARAASAAN